MCRATRTPFINSKYTLSEITFCSGLYGKMPFKIVNAPSVTPRLATEMYPRALSACSIEGVSPVFPFAYFKAFLISFTMSARVRIGMKNLYAVPTSVKVATYT